MLTIKFYSKIIYAYIKQQNLKAKWHELLCKPENWQNIIEGINHFIFSFALYFWPYRVAYSIACRKFEPCLSRNIGYLLFFMCMAIEVIMLMYANYTNLFCWS